MKKVIRLTETDLTRIVKRVIKENVENQWNDFASVMMGMNPKPKLLGYKGSSDVKKSQSLNWFNDINHYYSVSISSDEESIMITPQIKEKEIKKWWIDKGYKLIPSAQTFGGLITISISFSDAQKVRNDLSLFFKSIPPSKQKTQ